MLAAVTAPSAAAAIPASERTVLVNLYNATGGPAWTNNAGWSNAATGVNGAPGAECSWFGVGRDAGGNHVTAIILPNNHLVGTLPAIGNLTALQNFVVQYNVLTGAVPSVAGLTALRGFFVDHNELTGGLPSLAGLSALRFFYAGHNNLTGGVPSLAGLAALEEFYVDANQLTGSLPSLAGLANLKEFDARANLLTGSIPSLAGLANLVDFDVSDNGLTGAIPPLTGLTALTYFNVGRNQLTGSVPSLAGLASLQSFYAYLNQLSGPMALPPSPSALAPGESNVCVNQLQSTGNAAADAAWDTASGLSPVFGKPGWIACQGLSFGEQALGTTSAAQGINFAATVDSGTVTIISITASGDFAATHNCPSTLPVGQGCTVYVTFTPQALGPRTGDLTFVGSVPSTGQISGSLPLRGVGVAAPPPVTATAIPTLSELGLALLALTLGALGFAARRGRAH